MRKYRCSVCFEFKVTQKDIETDLINAVCKDCKNEKKNKENQK